MSDLLDGDVEREEGAGLMEHGELLEGVLALDDGAAGVDQRGVVPVHPVGAARERCVLRSMWLHVLFCLVRGMSVRFGSVPVSRRLGLWFS